MNVHSVADQPLPVVLCPHAVHPNLTLICGKISHLAVVIVATVVEENLIGCSGVR